jgi:1-acyl-sn-glycerol-3-phosphate acyltransferase
MNAESPRSMLPTVLEVLSSPLRELGVLDRMLLRAMAIASLFRVSSLSGLEYVGRDRDLFILVLNHNSHHEALLVPALLFFLRGGRRIHFLADWNFRLIPGIDLYYRRAGVITVTRKPAKPRLLNVMKPLFAGAFSPLEQARQHLVYGRSIGIFPEGTVNPDRLQLLRGRHGAARLWLETGVSVIPVGIRCSRTQKSSTILEGAMEITVGPPLATPYAAEGLVTNANVRTRHAQIMSAISTLSGKSWAFNAQETADEVL